MATNNSCDFATGAVGTVLTGTGVGSAPTFQAAASSGIVTLNGDSGSATGATVTIAGTTNEITTAGSGSTVTLTIPSTFTGPGTIGPTTNILLPLTTTSAANGVLKFNNTRWIAQYPTTIGTDAVFIGNNAGNLAPGAGTSDCIGDICIGTSTGTSIDSSGTITGNVIIGHQALKSSGSNLVQTGNVIIGYKAATAAGSNTNSNVIIGYLAGTALTNRPFQSVIIGANALDVATGTNSNYNVIIGYQAGHAFTAGESSNIMIGNGVGVAADANTVRIGAQGSGNGQQNLCFIAGISGVTVTGTAVLCSTTGALGTVASSERFKENIQDMGDESSALMNLRPVTFQFKDDKGGGNINNMVDPHAKQYGLIAEEVEKIIPELIVYDEDNLPLSVKYHDLPAMLLNEIQKLHKRIEALERGE